MTRQRLNAAIRLIQCINYNTDHYGIITNEGIRLIHAKAAQPSHRSNYGLLAGKIIEREKGRTRGPGRPYGRLPSDRSNIAHGPMR